MPRDFAVLRGGGPAFADPRPVGQLYFPDQDRYETAMRGIFERRYYTNHGPLARQLEDRLAQTLQVRHAVCVTNATIGLMMAVEALGLRGKVILPSFTFIASAQSLRWCGVEPVFCDVDPATHQIDPDRVAEISDSGVSGIMAVNLWGGACDIGRLGQIADDRGIPLFFDSAHGFGAAIDGRPMGGFGAAEVFSFHATKALSSAEGGCVTTNDDALAARLRNIRSSYGAGPPVPVVKTSNGRMSEAQAAIALMNLEVFPDIVTRNTALFEAYDEGLAGVPGLRFVRPAGVTASNHQYAVCELDPDVFGLTRDQLLHLLQAENVLARRYFYPGTHRCAGFDADAAAVAAQLPVTERLCQVCFQLPLGAKMSVDDVRTVCDLIADAQAQADRLRPHLPGAL